MLRDISKLLLAFRLQRAVAKHEEKPGEAETIHLARLLLKLSRTEEANAVALEGRAKFPDSVALRDVHQEIRHRQAALLLERARELLEVEPAPEGYIRAADLCRVMGDLDEAFSHIYEGKRVFPDHWGIHLSLGKLYFHRYSATKEQVDVAECLKNMGRARELAPDEPKVLFFLGLSLAVAGETPEALSTVQELITTHPEYPRARELQRRIRAVSANQPAVKHAARSRAAPAAQPESATREHSFHLEELKDKLSRIAGLLGCFIIDEEGELVVCVPRQNEVFDFDDSVDGLRALATGCRFDSSRIGMGDLISCAISGDRWQIFLRTLGPLNLITFFDTRMSPTVIEDLVGMLVDQVQVTLEGQPS